LSGVAAGVGVGLGLGVGLGEAVGVAVADAAPMTPTAADPAATAMMITDAMTATSKLAFGIRPKRLRLGAAVLTLWPLPW
jgi:hypothetical protein